MPQITALFSSAGRRVALIEAFRADAASAGFSFRAIAVDATPEWSAACAVADRSFKVPLAESAEFVPAIERICAEEKVNLLIPTIDHELQSYANHSEAFAKRGIHVAIGSPELVRIARDKVHTADFFRGKGIAAPRSAAVAELLATAQDWRWPVVLKPIAGSGSAHVQLTANAEELALVASLRPDYIAQEHIAGREFTVHQFYDRDGVLRCSVPHWRKEIRAGEVTKAVTWRHPALMKLAEQMAAALPNPRGPICFQGILTDEGEPFLIDLNARFGGGFPLAHKAGAQFPLWLMQEALGQQATAHNEWQDGLAMLRWDSAVFQNAKP
jgi:carbamoyl-phosphate synthase large subunit